MSLVWATPAALFLGWLLLGPILAHLTRRPPTEDRPFGLIFLLDRMRKKSQKRRKLHDLLLLLLRLLALAAILLAAARPELRVPRTASELGSSGRVIFVVDTSLSMDQRQDGESLFARARKEAAATLRSLPEGTSVAIVTAGGAGQVAAGWSPDHELQALKLEEQEIGVLGTDLRGALNQCRALLEGEAGEILVYTDNAGPGVVEAAREELGRLQEKGSQILPRLYLPPTPANLVPTQASYGDGLEGGTVTFTVANYGSEPREVAASIQLPEGPPITTFVTVPAATETQIGSTEGKITVPRQVKGGVASVNIDDPDLPADNKFYFHLPHIGASRVLVVDGDPGSTPTTSEVYFLERALSPFGMSAAGNDLLVDVVAPSGIQTLDPKRHRITMVANINDPVLVGPTLTSFVRDGGGLFLSMGENVSRDRYNSAFGGLLPALIDRQKNLLSPDDQPGSPLAPPDFSHPLLAPFAQAASSFQKVRVFSAIALEPFSDNRDTQTVLKSRDGIPLLILSKFGSGRVAVWTSTIDLGWTNLPLQSDFVPLMQRIVAFLGGDIGQGAGNMRASGTAGENIHLELSGKASSTEVLGPNGQTLPADRAADTLDFVPRELGAHSVKAPTGQVLAWVAVNSPPTESDIRVTAPLEAITFESAPEQTTRKIPLWTSLMLIASVFLVGAGLLATRTEHHEA